MNRAGEPFFVTQDELLSLHRLSIIQFGGLDGLRDAGLLESAIAQPQATFGGVWLHSYPAGMAAAYAFHLAKNHPFADGNKRAAWAAARHFLIREGFAITVTDDEAIDIMLGVAGGSVDKESLTAWFTQRIGRGSSLEVRDFFGELNIGEFVDRVTAIAKSYKSGGAAELTAVVNETSRSIPIVGNLAQMYVQDREANASAIHFIQVLAAIHRIAEDQGYEW